MLEIERFIPGVISAISLIHVVKLPVKSKLQHPLPGHLVPFPAREGGHLITTHMGWGIWLLASILCYESRWFHVSWSGWLIMAETTETNFDEFKGKDCVFVADWLKTKGLQKLCSVFEVIFHKRVRGFHQVSKREKHLKPRGRRPSAFIVFERLQTWWNPKHEFLKLLLQQSKLV